MQSDYTVVMQERTCVFCGDSALRLRTIFADELAFAFPTNIPITPGHTLIAPVRCVRTFDELTSEEQCALFSLRARVGRALKAAFGAEGFHFAWNEGETAGQSVPHFHLHIVPRKAGDCGITEYEPRKFLYRPGSREPSPEAELQAVAEKIKKAL